jgi:hypothetical protein
MQPTAWNRVPLPQLVKEIPTVCVEPEDALTCSLLPDTDPYPESDKSNPHSSEAFVKV